MFIPSAKVRDVIMGPSRTKVLNLKHIAKQITDLDRAFLGQCVNVILLRDPIDILSSVS